MAVVAILCAPQATVPVLAQDLATYAETCGKEVGASVSGFNCLSGFEIDMKGDAGGDCEKPPYLHKTECRAGSRLGVQETDNPNIAVVWLCRKKKVTDPVSNIFDDVAVIQTNFENGATCFYQHLGDAPGQKVPAPDQPGADKFWMTPAKAAKQECASCHDAGLLRTPYLTQVKNKEGEKVLPKDLRTTEYWFPGEAFRDWNGKVYRIVDTTQPEPYCTKCHAMGGNAIDPKVGTSTWLGLMATGERATPHLKPNPDFGQHAFWMKPGRKGPNKQDQDETQRVSDCALGKPVRDCSRTPWGGQTEAVIKALQGRVPPELKSIEGKDYPEHDNK